DPLTVVTFDWTASTMAEVKRIEHLNRMMTWSRRDHLAWWTKMPYGAGQLVNPRVVLIGESPSPRARIAIPFANGPAGDFLAETIVELEDRGSLKLDELYVTNAQKGAKRDDRLLFEELTFLIG